MLRSERKLTSKYEDAREYVPLKRFVPPRKTVLTKPIAPHPFNISALKETNVESYTPLQSHSLLFPIFLINSIFSLLSFSSFILINFYYEETKRTVLSFEEKYSRLMKKCNKEIFLNDISEWQSRKQKFDEYDGYH